MPAPQVVGRAVALDLRPSCRCGATQAGVLAVPPVVGNGRAVACNVALTWAGVSDGCADSISATVPETSGAEKLVPIDVLKLSV